MRTKLLLLLKLVLSIGLAALFYTQAELAAVSSILRDAVPAYLILGLVLNYLGGITVQSKVTLMTSKDLTVGLMRMDMINLGLRFYSMVLPLLAVSVMRWHRYTKLGCSKMHAVFLMLLNKSLQNLIIAGVMVSALAIYFELFNGRLGYGSGLLLGAAAVAFTITAVLVLLLTGQISLKPLVALFQRTNRLLPERLSKYLASKVGRFEETITISQTMEHSDFVRVIALSAGSFTLIVGSQYSLALALGLEVPVLVIAFARSLVQLLMMIPLSVGGIGFRELGFIAGLGVFDVSMEVALALSLLLLATQLVLGAVGGLLEAWNAFATRDTVSPRG